MKLPNEFPRAIVLGLFMLLSSSRLCGALPFTGDPFHGRTDTFITNEFMQQEPDPLNPSQNPMGQLHKGVDVYAPEDAIVWPGLGDGDDANNFCTVFYVAHYGSVVPTSDVYLEPSNPNYLGRPVHLILAHLKNCNLEKTDLLDNDNNYFVGQIGGEAADGSVVSIVHIELDLGDIDNPGLVEHLNPCLHVYGDAGWMSDTESPRLDPNELPAVECHLNSDTEFIIPACDYRGHTENGVEY
jgi:hypothetical protein